MKPVIALLTGGLAGTGVLAANPSAYATAALAGLLGALTTSVVLKRSISWSRQRSVSREDLFVPNLSVATLDRVLPVLIERIRLAGLAPVFVVDELDKVVGLSQRITEMVRRLKKFVAENAFFCFLTDRLYFEEMRERTANAPYPIEYTYFTNQVFVAFKHQDLHQYLGSVLEPPTAESAKEGVGVEQLVADREAYEYSADYPVLPYILLHASQMHPIDLHRQLAAVRNSMGQVSLEPGAVRSRPRYRSELMIQVAIEIVLEEEDMQAELDRQPAFLRLAHDAMYYISRRWADAPERLVLEAEGIADFDAYLSGRMTTDTPPKESQQRSREVDKDQQSATYMQAPATHFHEAPPQVEPAQRKFLMDCVRELAALLASPVTLRERAKAKGPQVVLDALPSDPLLYRVEGKEHVYRWRCYQSGRPIEHEGAEEKRPKQVPLETDWKESADFINRFEETLAELTRGSIEPSTLSSQFGIIGTTPAWADVKRALARLRTAQTSSVAYPEQDADVVVLNDFGALLKRSGDNIALALVFGEVIGKWKREQQSVLRGLKVISDAFWLRDMSGDQVRSILLDFAEQISIRFKIADVKDPPALSSTQNLAVWAEWVTHVQSSVLLKIDQREDILRESQRESWRSWYTRLQSPAAQQGRPDLSDIICMAARAGPAQYLKFDFNSMTLGEWSEVLSAVILEKPEDPSYAPPWLFLAALQQLGFTHQVLTWVDASHESSGREIWFGNRKLSDEEIRDCSEWKAPLKSEGRRPSTLIVSKSARPVIAHWRPSQRYAAIVLGVDSVARLVEVWKPIRDTVLPFLALDFISFEMPVERTAEKRDRMFRSEYEMQVSNPLDRKDQEIIAFFQSEPKRKIPLIYLELPSIYMPHDYYAITAKSLEDLFSKAGSQPL